MKFVAKVNLKISREKTAKAGEILEMSLEQAEPFVKAGVLGYENEVSVPVVKAPKQEPMPEPDMEMDAPAPIPEVKKSKKGK